MNLMWLAVLAFVEAIVWLLRFRTATERSALVSGLMSFLIATMRIVFVFVGVSAILEGTQWYWAVLVYAGTVAFTTGVLHEYLERHKENSEDIF